LPRPDGSVTASQTTRAQFAAIRARPLPVSGRSCSRPRRADRRWPPTSRPANGGRCGTVMVNTCNFSQLAIVCILVVFESNEASIR
jgi:hypothetical protein